MMEFLTFKKMPWLARFAWRHRVGGSEVVSLRFKQKGAPSKVTEFIVWSCEA